MFPEDVSQKRLEAQIPLAALNRLNAMEWSGKEYLVCDGHACSGTSWLRANRLQKETPHL